MRWKEIFLGALATLFVTVIGGVGVYYFTKEPKVIKEEKLVYTLMEGGVFEGNNKNIALSSARFSNDGLLVAENVSVTLTFQDSKVSDFSFVSGSELKESFREIKDKTIKLTFDRILPSESFKLNLLLTQPEKPKVAMRSDKSFGKEKYLSQIMNPSRKSPNAFIELFIPMTGTILIGMLLFGYRYLRKSGIQLSKSKNNVGFLLLHQGLIQEAHEIINSGINEGQYDVFLLSNLALCKALLGDRESADKLIKAAKFKEMVGHGNAVIGFNEALIFLTMGDKEKALEKLEESIKKSSKRIRQYCDHSIHLDSIRETKKFKALMT